MTWYGAAISLLIGQVCKLCILFILGAVLSSCFPGAPENIKRSQSATIFKMLLVYSPAAEQPNFLHLKNDRNPEDISFLMIDQPWRQFAFAKRNPLNIWQTNLFLKIKTILPWRQCDAMLTSTGPEPRAVSTARLPEGRGCNKI